MELRSKSKAADYEGEGNVFRTATFAEGTAGFMGDRNTYSSQEVSTVGKQGGKEGNSFNLFELG